MAIVEITQEDECPNLFMGCFSEGLQIPGSLNTVTEEFHLCSENCLGIFIAKRSVAPGSETDDGASSDDDTSVEDRSMKKKSRMRRHCSHLQ